MKKLYKRFLTLASIPAGALFFIYASSGPALNFNAGYTGSPYDNLGQTCNTCHYGGSYSPSVTIQLLNGTTPVTSYTPGTNYTVRLTLNAGTGTPQRYGFQMWAMRTTALNSVNTWGTMPAGTHSYPATNGRTYVEHGQKLTSNIINIPWTGPAAGVGSITFYAAGNFVNNDGSTYGDQAAASSLVVPVTPLALTWLYFRGNTCNGFAYLEWASANESELDHYTLEKSRDGEHFEVLAEIRRTAGKQAENSRYYTDAQAYGDCYYRLSETGLNGEKHVYKTIRLKGDAAAKSWHHVSNDQIIIHAGNEADLQAASVTVFSLDARRIATEIVGVVRAGQEIRIPKPDQKGLFLLTVKSGASDVYHSRIWLP